MSELIAEKDWSKTPVGEPEQWPPALRTVLDVILANRFPVVFWWGRELIQFYNDQYRVILGTKHPASLGQRMAECWHEIFHVVGPLAESVLSGGPSTWNEDLLLEMNRYGFMEETYFTFSYSALPDESAPGGIGGVLGTVQETTRKVIGERRMRLLRDLAARANEVKSVDEECDLAAQTLERYATDVPFALIYLHDQTGPAQLCASAGVDLDAVEQWRLAFPHQDDGLVVVDDLNALLGTLPRGPWAEPPTRAAVVPIPSSVPGENAGSLVLGISSRLAFDESYRDFFKLVSAQVGSALASARAYEEERRRAEALAELDRAKNVFFSNVSHEFRTPLTLMLGPLTELEKIADENAKPLVQTAHRNSLRLLKLVNTLLEFSRLEAGRSDAVYAETDLAALTEELCSVFRSAIESAGLQFELDIRLTEQVYVDRGMWEKIVLNLLSNALKFTLEGRIRVVLSRAGEAAELRVEDSGIGIDANELSHLFERFRRVRAVKARSHEGSGIGLALVKDLVDLHGGSVGVESRLGKGSTFVVRVPLGHAHLDSASVTEDGKAPVTSSVIDQYLADLDATMAAAIPHHPVLPTSSNSPNRKRILLADDNADLREYVSRVLSPVHDVVAVRNGVEALEAAHKERFDVIISDVMMPQMDGFELLRRVRGEPNLSTTPFIILSARAGEEASVEGVAAGADDYIAKPFEAEELLARVQANVNAATLREEAWELSEHRFHAFADRLPMMVWQQDVTGRVVYANTAWYAITGLPQDASAFDESSWRSVIHPDDYERVVDAFRNAVTDRGTFTFEYRVKRADADASGYRWYIASSEPQYTLGVLTGWTGYLVDIHDTRTREEFERRLREQATEREQAFHALAEAVPVIVWSADESGSLDWYNNRWYEYTGQTPEEASGWGWQAAHHPDDFPLVMQAWPNALETGERFEMEFRLRRRDGVFHWFLTRAEPQRDEQGIIRRWYGSCVDIQSQKEALEQSRRVAETLQGVFLPEALPHTEDVRFDAVYVAAEKDALIGGDWFDAMQLPDGRYLVSIGDVTGHGLDASVIAGALRQAILGFALRTENTAAILNDANQLLRLQYPDKYATALIALIDAGCAAMEFASAGHPPPLFAQSRGEGTRELPCSGLPLGVEENPQVVARRTALPRDAVLAFYTDGLVEFARDIESAERVLASAVERLVGDTAVARPAVAIQKAVLGDIRPVDDVAILVAQFSSVPADSAAFDQSGLVKEWRFHSSDPHTARASRHELMKFIRRYAADPDALFDAELVLGEILANTVEHAPGLVEISIDWRESRPTIIVRDTGPGLAQLCAALPEDPLDENGRGLFLVQNIAHDVSVKRAAGFGTELRATLPIARESQTMSRS